MVQQEQLAAAAASSGSPQVLPAGTYPPSMPAPPASTAPMTVDQDGNPNKKSKDEHSGKADKEAAAELPVAADT